MGYVIEEGTLGWAEKRVQQLREAETEIGCALEHLEGVPKNLQAGAFLMEEQPESDVMRSFGMDVEKLHKDLSERLKEMIKDRKRLQTAIRKYKEANHEWDS